MKSKSAEGGRWRRFLDGRRRIRLPLTLALAVVLPAVALICVNLYHLQSIQRNKVLEAAIHRDFQQMLAIAEKQINYKAYQIVEELGDAFPSSGADKEATVRKLDLLLSEHPAVAHVFLFDADTGLILRSQPGQMGESYFYDEHHRFEKSFAGWLSYEGKTVLDSVRKKSRPVTWYGERTKRNGRSTYMTTAMFPLPHFPRDRVVLGGATFEPG